MITEDTVDWRPDFGEEGNAKVAELVEGMRPRAQFYVDLRESLGLSQAEFLDIWKDGLKVNDLIDLVLARGGNIAVTIPNSDGTEVCSIGSSE